MKQSMINLFVLISFLCMGLDAFAQGRVNFEPLTFKEALEKAKKEKKQVFLDASTSWCTYCKKMDKEVFVQDTVGKYFNKHFINVKYDMEKGDGPELCKRYGIVSFPTFLVLDTDGNVQHKFVGYRKAEALIQEVEKRFNKSYASGTIESRYNKGDRSVDVLYEYAKSLLDFKNPKALQVATELVAALSDEERINEKYWFIFFRPLTAPRGSANATYLIENYTRFCSSLGEEKPERAVLQIHSPVLKGVLFGNAKESVTLAELEKIEQEIEPLPSSIRDYIQLYITLTRFVLQGEYDKFIKTCCKELGNFSDNRTAETYTGMMNMVCKNVTTEQREAWLTLGKSLIENMKDRGARQRMESFVNQSNNIE